jgi:small-conductance mechanosensitive channel
MSSKDISARKRDLRASTAERLEAIVEAAERAAEGVIDDAEEQARAYLAEARARADREAEERLRPLAGLTDSLLAEAAALRQQAERLQATLEEAKARLEQNGALPAEEPRERRGHLAAVAPITDGRVPVEQDSERGGAPSGARLLATQMAVSGSSREEIERRLRNEFGIEDAHAILDAIMGPEES